MFDIQNVKLSFGARTILEDANLKLDQGDRAAIIGPNGAGKSTLLKIVAGVNKPETGKVAFPRNTEIGYLPQDMELESSKTVMEECRTIYQDVLEHEQEMRELEVKMAEVDSEGEEFAEIADRYEYLIHETQRRDLYTMDITIAKVLTGLGFKEEELERSCDTFSGGWQMRICLAKILLQNPDVLLLDEPTNHLDIETIEWLTDWIKVHEGSVLMVSHERAFMDALVTKVVELEHGKLVVYRGNYTDAIQKREERREMQLRTYENQQQQIAHMQKFIDRFRYQASKAALVQSRVKQLEKVERVSPPTADPGTIHFKFPPAPRSGKEVLTVECITKSYGEKTVLRNISFTVYRGEKIALVGVNGAGKTTLMRIIAGRDDSYQGKYAYGSSVDMAYFAQYDKEDLHPNNSVEGEFMSSAPLSVSDRARSILGAFLFSGDDVDKKISMLSGGERTRLRLAKMLCGTANLLLLDEPTNHLDIGSRLTLENALKQYEGSVMLVSHDRYFLDNVVNRVIEISDGQVRNFIGNYEDYLAMRDLAGGYTEAQQRTTNSLNQSSKEDAGDTSVTSSGAKESKEDREDRKRKEKEAKNRLNKVTALISEHEEAVYELEEQVRLLENELADPANSSEHEKLIKLGEKLKSINGKKDEVETTWLELQQEQEELEEFLG